MKTKHVTKSKPKPKPQHKKPKPKSKDLSVSHFSPSVTADFAAALRDPFAPSSYGTKVPDPFSFPTTTFHLHGEVILGNSATSGTAIFYPNPVLSLYDCSTCVNASPTSMTRYVNTTPAYGATTPAQLGAMFGMYRVSSWGIKISNLIPELSATGRIIVAPFVCGDTVPSYNVLSNVAISADSMTLDTTGFSFTSLNSSSVLNMPDAIEFSMQDFLHGSLEVGCTVVNPSFFDFKTAQLPTQYNTLGLNTYSEGDDVLLGRVSLTGALATTSQTSFAGFKDPTRMRGGVGWIVYFEGLSEGIGNSFLVEYIYHLEGTANIGNGSTKGVPVPSQTPTSFPGSTAAVETAMASNTAPKVMSWIVNGAQFLNKASHEATGQGILAHAQTVAGMHPVTSKMFSFAKRFF